MIRVNVFEIKARLSEYLNRASRGETIVVCRHNKPVAELRPLGTHRTEPRPVGRLPGRPSFEVPASFFEPLSDSALEEWESVAAGPLMASLSSTPGPRTPSRVADSKRAHGGSRRHRRRGPRS